MTAHVSEEKKKTVKELTQLIDEYPVVAVANMENLPAGNLASMRTKLRGKVVIRMAKKRVIQKAFEASTKPEIKQLSSQMKGVPALLLTKENPFSLFKTLKKNQSKAAIKAGQTAPTDLTVPAGPTSFPPGPIIGELGQLGIKAGVEQGKVVIKQDSVVAKEGAVVNDKVASFLAKMGLEPMRIGINLVAAYEHGKILESKVLDIDEERFMANLKGCIMAAKNLAFNASIPLKENIDMLIQKAHYDAAGLALEANLIIDDARAALAQSYYQATGVAKYLSAEEQASVGTAAPQASNASVKEEKKEDKKEEDAAAGLGSLFG